MNNFKKVGEYKYGDNPFNLLGKYVYTNDFASRVRREKVTNLKIEDTTPDALGVVQLFGDGGWITSVVEDASTIDIYEKEIPKKYIRIPEDVNAELIGKKIKSGKYPDFVITVGSFTYPELADNTTEGVTIHSEKGLAKVFVNNTDYKWYFVE